MHWLGFSLHPSSKLADGCCRTPYLRSEPGRLLRMEIPWSARGHCSRRHDFQHSNGREFRHAFPAYTILRASRFRSDHQFNYCEPGSFAIEMSVVGQNAMRPSDTIARSHFHGGRSPETTSWDSGFEPSCRFARQNRRNPLSIPRDKT